MAKVQGLGRGLSSLIPKKGASGVPMNTGEFRSNEFHSSALEDISHVPSETTQPAKVDSVVSSKGGSGRGCEVLDLDITLINPNAYQPRKYFREEDLETLANSIREYGILQPLIVTESENGRYELVAGERRLQAAKRAGLKSVPAIVRSTIDDQRRLELALIENIHRSDLNAVEEARAYKLLSEEFDLTQESVAERVGKSRSTIANILRLLELPIEVQRGLIEGMISEGHARVIVSLKGIERQLTFFKLICDEKLNVRQAELRAKQTTPVRAHERVSAQDPDIRAMQQRLEDALQTHVVIKQHEGRGMVSIVFRSKEDLDAILSKMSSV